MGSTTRRDDRLHDRKDAGRRLAQALERYRGVQPVVLGIPRGGVLVAAEIARSLDRPLDVLVVRKIGDPSNPEHGLGAVAEGGIRILDEERMRELGRTDRSLEPVVRRELAELQRRLARYRAGAPRVEVRGRTVILADDGVATGGTVRAGVEALRASGAGAVVLALGVCPESAVAELRRSCDDLVVLLTPLRFYAVGEWFDEFDEVSDEEVTACMRTANPV